MIKCAICNKEYRKEILDMLGIKKEFEVSNCNCESIRDKKITEKEMLFAKFEWDRIPKRYWLNINKWEKSEQTQKAYDKVMEYISNIKENIKEKKGLGLFGPVGCGKTWLCSWVLIQAILKNYSVKFINYLDYVASIGKDNSYYDVVEENIERETIKMLFVDDITCEGIPEWKYIYVSRFIDKIYNCNKSILFTGNRFDESLVKQLGSNVVSRIVGLCGKNIVSIKEAKDMRCER